jgi:hypothetical protein
MIPNNSVYVWKQHWEKNVGWNFVLSDNNKVYTKISFKLEFAHGKFFLPIKVAKENLCLSK